MPNVKASSQAGFSLVETVAAMGILALAAIPLMQVTTNATRNTASLEERLLARTVAENVMARAMAASEIIEGGIETGEETQLGRTFVWTRTATPAQVGALQNLSVEVRPAERQQTLASLISLKYTPQALPGSGTFVGDEGDGS
ncbi:MAG: type II secretion system minor pseudopilin GspI [Pseudomonadota bacterium]